MVQLWKKGIVFTHIAIYVQYVKHIENEKHMILLIDEIYVKSYLDYGCILTSRKAENIVGTACNNTSNAYVFLVTSIN